MNKLEIAFCNKLSIIPPFNDDKSNNIVIQFNR